MNHHASATLGAEEVRLADGSLLRTATYRLPAFDWGEFQVVVDAEAPDEISQALRQQTFRLPADFRVLEDWGKPGSRVLDLGAHIGTFALLAATLGCQVAAVEASPRNCVLLQASLQANHFTNLQIINSAISDQVGTLNFMPSGPYGLVANPAIQLPSIQLPATTVDALLAQLGWAQVDLIKMAIEGSAAKAVAGMARLLQRSDAPPLLFEANGHRLAMFDETPQQLLAQLEGYGYRCYRVEPTALRLTPASSPQWACVTNYLALKATVPPKHWQFLPPLTQQESSHELQMNARHPHEHFRAHVGRLLAQAEPALLHERSSIRTLQALQADPHPAVQAAVAWWRLQDMPLAVRMMERVARLRTKKP